MLKELLDWSEVWAPFAALVLVSFRKEKPRYLMPLIAYLWLALIIGASADAGWKFQLPVQKVFDDYCAGCVPSKDILGRYMQATPAWMYPNNYLYNIHSIVRFLCFGIFFWMLSASFRTKWDKLAYVAVALFVVINFAFFEKFNVKHTPSSRLLSIECGVLLFFCLRYYLYHLQPDTNSRKNDAAFWVVNGLSIYVVFNFFLFLLYDTLVKDEKNDTFLTTMWNFHNITFIILCGFIARAFYAADENGKTAPVL